MYLRVLAIAAVLLALLSSSARAEQEWYGHHVLATDVGGCALVAGGWVADLPSMVISGLGVMMLGGPVVHAAHSNGGRAAASLGLRTGGVLVGGAIGYALSNGNDRWGALGSSSVGIGALIGYVAAAVVDIAVIAREDDATAATRMFSVGGRF